MRWLLLICCFSSGLSFGQKAPDLKKFRTKGEKLQALTEYCDELIVKEEYRKLRSAAQQGLRMTDAKDYFNRSLFSFYAGTTFNYGVEGDSAAYYLERSETFARKANDPRRILEALKQLHYVYANYGETKKQERIVSAFEKAIDTIRKLEVKGEIYSVIGDYYVNRGQYETGLSNLIKGIQCRRKALPKGNAANSTNLGVQMIVVSELYIGIRKHDLALEYLNEAAPLVTDYNEASAHIYKDLIDCYAYKNQLKSAKKAYADLLALLKNETSIGCWGMLVESDLIFARYYTDRGDFKNALRFTDHAGTLVKEYADDFQKAQLEVTTGLIYLKKREYRKALGYFKTAEPTTAEDDPELNAELKQALAETYSGLGNWKEAYRYQKEHAALQDKLTREKSKKNIAEMEARYQNERKQGEIERLSAQGTINNLKIAEASRQRFYLLLVLLAVLVIGILFYVQSRNRKRHNAQLQVLNEELKQGNANKTRFFSIINHDLRSPVANLIHFLQLQKDSPDLMDQSTKERLETRTMESAESLLRSMEDMLLWSKGQMEQFQPVVSDLKVSAVFSQLQQYFASEDRVLILVDEETEMILPTDLNYLLTILRNLTANAIKALSKTEDPVIRWSAKRQSGQTVLTITDNGPGAAQSQFKALYDPSEVVGIKTGLGLHLIRDLAAAIHCEIVVASDSSGTKISLFFDHQ